jgi:ankyrin repeat protein
MSEPSMLDLNLGLRSHSKTDAAHWAAQIGHRKFMQTVFGTGNLSIDLVDKNGQTPLSYAAENGNGK